MTDSNSIAPKQQKKTLFRVKCPNFVCVILIIHFLSAIAGNGRSYSTHHLLLNQSYSNHNSQSLHQEPSVDYSDNPNPSIDNVVSRGTDMRADDNLPALSYTSNTRIFRNSRLLNYYDDDDTDDRHNKIPDEHNLTNQPIEEFTKMPSNQPSTRPSSKPSIMPTISPSLSPSSSPSSSPSVSPSSSPSNSFPFQSFCKNNNGTFFGDTKSFSNTTNSTTENSKIEPIILHYNYKVEANETRSKRLYSSFTDQMNQLETVLLNVLIGHLFPVCKDISNGNGYDNSRSLNIFALSVQGEMKNFMKRTGIIGLDSHPIDFATGESCNDEVNAIDKNDISCYIIEGQLSIYFSDVSRISYGKQMIISTIKSMMKSGELIQSHSAIVKVQFRYSNDDSLSYKSLPDDDYSNNDDMEKFFSIIFSVKWMTVIGLSIGMIPLILFFMQQYYKQKSLHMEQDESLQEVDSIDYDNELYNQNSTP